ncbi:hypothetical protein Tsubulata_023556 [Turnera subulata]|uniref:Uncharacterized protein n=1 Tax=Turnera subulata TaxID=218843 RepID=A0A9Q0G1H2_9ROSI|nr:hypothetical protein Tsubulata_023556 [Turnera subulata]
MESSKIIGSAKECSSESGWTSYLVSRGQGSNIDDEGDYSTGDYGYNTNKQRYYRKGDAAAAADSGESDDSMTSDASSGPSHCEPFHGSNEDNHGRSHLKGATSKCPSKEKPYRNVKQRDGARIRVGKEESFFKAKTAVSHVQSSIKESQEKHTSQFCFRIPDFHS